MHGKAKEQAEIDGEKEKIETATIQAMGKNKYGNITVDELQQELEDDAIVKKIRKKVVVTINASQRMYYVDDNGNVFEYEYVDLPIMENGIDFYNRMADYRTSILTVTVLDNINIAENTYQVFDVSKEQNETIKAWLIENSENTNMYDLYIGGNDGVEIENCSNLFSELSNCVEINLENLYTENVTSMGSMFRECKSLTRINISNFDTCNVTDMSYMFYGCANLINIDVSDFDTRNVTTMQYMFYNCNSLINIDVSKFDTGNVTNMALMFFGCKSFTSLDLSSFDTNKVTIMQSMFYNCHGLTKLNLSNFNTSNVISMDQMFFNCNKLENLDITKFDMINVTNYSNIFGYVPMTVSITTNSNTANWIKTNFTNYTNIIIVSE